MPLELTTTAVGGRENYLNPQQALGTLCGEHPEESAGVFECLAEQKTRSFVNQPKTSVIVHIIAIKGVYTAKRI